MNYRVIEDGASTSIETVDAEPNGFSIFQTFTEAKQQALENMRAVRNMYNDGINYISRMTKSEVN